MTVAAAALFATILAGAGPAAASGHKTAVVAAPSARLLAVSTGARLFLVSGSTVTQMGPVLAPGGKGAETISGAQWSASGRYLGWEQWAKGNGAGEVAWYDTLSHRRAQWPISSFPFVAGWSVTNAGVQAFVPGLDITSPSSIISFSTKGTKSTKSVHIPLSDGAAGYSGGFIVGPDIKTSTQLWRVSAAGAVTRLATLPKPPKESLYEVTAASPDGKVLVAELGDHTDGCGVGPGSKLYVLNTSNGAIKKASLPSGPKWRVWSFVFDPTDAVDATMVNCTEQSIMQATVFGLSSSAAITAKRAGALVGTVAAGQVAYQLGHIKLASTTGGPYLQAVAAGPLNVGGRPIAALGAATTASWAP